MPYTIDKITGYHIAKLKDINPKGGLALISHHGNSNNQNKLPVLFFHGATVPTLMTSAYKISGWSWFDAVSEDQRPVYGLDLLGYGESDKYPDKDEPGEKNPSEYGVGPSLTTQIDKVVDMICAKHLVDRIHIVAISRGAIPAGYYATTYSKRIASLTLHGPITRQKNLGSSVVKKYFGSDEVPNISHFSISAKERFGLLRDDRPSDTTSTLESDFVKNWAADYSLRAHGSRDLIDLPIAAPMGFAVDICNAWNDQYFDETKLTMPTLVFRGEWDMVLTPEQSCQDLFKKIPGGEKLYIQFPQATHSMMYEKCRHSMYKQMLNFINNHE